MAAKATVALGKELGDLKDNYDKLQKHLFSVEKTYHNLILTEKHQDGEIPISIRLQLMAAQLFRSDMFSDVTILLQGGIQVHAHKFVLAASGNNWGVHEFDKVDMLDLTDIRYEVCYAMIKWVYTDEFDFHHKINDDFLIELMQAASICKLESLFIRCQKGLSSILNYENCEKFLKVSEDLESTILKGNCMKILQEKQEALKPKQITAVKIVIPSPIKDSPRVTRSKSTCLSVLETQNNVKEASGTGNKKQTKTVSKAKESAESILQCIEKSSVQFKLEKVEVTSQVVPIIADESDCQPMDEGLKTKVDQTADADDTSDADPSDDCWENFDSQIPETPSAKDEGELKDPQQQNSNVTKGKSVDMAAKTTAIQDATMPIDGEKSAQSQVENSINEESHLVNGKDKSDNTTKNPVVKSFTCDVCDKSFTKKDYLKKHKVIHEPFKPHQCPDCFKTFHNQGDLRKHIKIHDKKWFQCDECGKCLRSFNGLEIHKATHLPDSGVKCTICDKYLRNKVILMNHMYIHTGEKNFTCDICNKSFRQQTTLNAHKKIHSGLKPYMCDVCGKSFVDSIHLKRHKSVHIIGNQFQCTKCDKSFRQKNTLNKHYSTHEDVYRCDYCSKILLSVEEYQTHRATHLAPGQTCDILPERVFYSPKPFCCEVCGKTFQTKSLLKCHMSVHTGERPFVCAVCNKTFRTKQLYTEHKTLHTGEQPHKCDFCGRAFRLYSTMSAHRKTHNTELSFTCEVCGKAFTTSAYLIKHKVSHRPDKPFKCDLCGMGFRFGSARNTHRKDHDVTARGGYECPSCGKKGFQSKSWFNAHKKKCRETPKLCAVCGFHFTRSHNYKHHMEKYGNVNPHYHCSKCFTVCTDSQSLHNHDCTPKERISCPYCPAVVMGRLKRHLESCHPEKVDPEGTRLLTREEKRATAEKFTCPFCEVQVLSVNSLRRHIRTIHKDVKVSEITRESVSIVPATCAVESPQKTEQVIVTQEVQDWNPIFPDTLSPN